MISFIVSVVLLIVGYIVYGRIVEKVFGVDDRVTPVHTMYDGIDYVQMPRWKIFLIQLLNIAGLGPIFGALQGAQWGPIVFLWIVFGSIFAGGVHDYMSGMLSLRHKGATIAELCGIYMGDVMKVIMTLFSVALLVLLGTVFVIGPAGLIVALLKSIGISGIIVEQNLWIFIIFIYYFVATFLSIDTVIGRIYPFFCICLIVMAIGVISGIFINPDYVIPEVFDNFNNMHATNVPVWSYMFITVACGAISGFHSTQSPIMARCIEKEKDGRRVFYGAMIAEGVIALVWAAAGCAVYKSQGGLNIDLNAVLAQGQSTAIYDVCVKTMGKTGVILAMIGVIVCPITSGDTAFRSARLIIAEWFHLDQRKIANRLIIAVPMIVIGMIIGKLDYGVVWRYFSWFNQALAMLVLWVASMYLAKLHRNYFITVIPATFMSAVTITYLLSAPECYGSVEVIKNMAYPAGIIVSFVFLGVFMYNVKKLSGLKNQINEMKKKKDDSIY